MNFKAQFGSGMKKINTYNNAQMVKIDDDYRSDGTINGVNSYSDEYLNSIPDYNTVLEEVGQLAGNANNGSGYIDDDYFVSLGASSYHSSDSSNGVINLSEVENAIFYSQEQYLNYCENLKKQREYLNGEIRFIENQFMFSRDASNDVYGQFIGHEYADEDNWIEKEITYAYKDKNGQYVTTTETFKFYNGIWANVDGSTGYYSPPDQICSRSNPLENTSYIEEFCKKNGLVWGPGTKELNAFYEYIDGEYTDMFNEYLINKCDVSYDVYKQYQHDVLTIDSYEYALRQKAKVAPFNAIAVTDEYKRYVDAYVNDGKFSSVQQRNKLTDDELVMYTYLFDTRGEGAAKEYINAMEDTINQRIALAQSTNFDNFASVSNWLVSDKDGNINYASTAANLSKLFPSLGIKGFGDGIESFGEGLKNVFAADGVISANSYEQMYIIQALTGSSSTYINELAKEITDEQKLKEFASNIYDKNGNINWTYANSVLDSTQFNVLRNKVSQDQIGADVLSHVYNISTSIGNMAIPVAISTIISIVAPQVGIASVATAATIGEWTGTVLMGLSAGGNSGNQVLIDGGTLTQAWEYGLVSGLSEACLEKIGGIMGIGNASGGFIKSMFSEGREEFIQEYLDAGFQSLILGKEFNFKDTSYAAFQSFCYGALSAGVMNGATGAVYGAIKMTMPNGEVLSLQECMEKYGDMSKEQYESIMGKTGFNIPVLASQYALDNNMTLAQAKFAVTFGLSPDVMSKIIQMSQENSCSLSEAYVMSNYDCSLAHSKYVIEYLRVANKGLSSDVSAIMTEAKYAEKLGLTYQQMQAKIQEYVIHGKPVQILYNQIDNNCSLEVAEYMFNYDFSYECAQYAINYRIQPVDMKNIESVAAANKCKLEVASLMINNNCDVHDASYMFNSGLSLEESQFARRNIIAPENMKAVSQISKNNNCSLEEAYEIFKNNLDNSMVAGIDVLDAVIKSDFDICFDRVKSGEILSVSEYESLIKGGISFDDMRAFANSHTTYEQQKVLIDAIQEMLFNGYKISSDVYKAIFNSKIFDADSKFSETYLRDVIIKLGNNTAASIRFADLVTEIYNDAKFTTSNPEMGQLHSFCDHRQAHVLQVAFLSAYSLDVIDNAVKTGNNGSIIDGEVIYGEASENDRRTMFIAGLLHDLGMSAGTTLGNPFDANSSWRYKNPAMNSFLRLIDGKYEVVSKTLDYFGKIAKDVRNNHTNNSANIVLQYRDMVSSLGVNPDIVAVLCYAHSKSNSGVVKLNHAADWMLCIQKVDSAITAYNNDPNRVGSQIVFDKTSFTSSDSSINIDYANLQGTEVTSGQKDLKKAPFFAKKIEFNQELLSRMASMGLAIRVGDAYVSKAKINLDEPISWVYNGKTFTATKVILTEAGVYMAYDPTSAVYFDNLFNSGETESNQYGAFIYLKQLDDGSFVPWNPPKRNQSGELVESTHIYNKNETGAFVIDSEECLMTLTGASVRKIGNVEYQILDNGYYQVEHKNQDTGVKTYTYYKFDEINGVMVELTSEELIQNNVTDGKLVFSTGGQFLSGESNIEYWFDVKEFLVRVKNKETGEIETQTKTYYYSEYTIEDITSFRYNTIEKGIAERIGEIASAAGLEHMVNIRFEGNLSNYFEIRDGVIVSGYGEIGSLFFKELRALSSASITFQINGIYLFR